MIARFSTWFASRAPRERWLLIIMAALAVLTMLWGGIIRPVGDGLSSSRERHANAVIRLAATEARLATLQRLQRDRPAPLGAPLETVLRERASAAGFPLGSVNPQGMNQVQIVIPSARPGALLGWIASLEESGILIDSLNLTDNGDRTIAAQMTLRARGV